MAGFKFTKKSKGVTIDVNINIPVEDILDKGTAANIGETMRKQSIDFMEAGVSPVTGRKFELYKNPDKYPEGARKKYSGKRNTPVNLKLSGDLHDSLSYKKSSDMSIEFGLINPKGNAAVYGPVHNKDDKSRPDIPERRFLPTRKGEEFNRSIMLAIKRLIVDRLGKLLKK